MTFSLDFKGITTFVAVNPSFTLTSLRFLGKQPVSHFLGGKPEMHTKNPVSCFKAFHFKILNYLKYNLVFCLQEGLCLNFQLEYFVCYFFLIHFIGHFGLDENIFFSISDFCFISKLITKINKINK